jgi:hypothetical protein
LNLENCQIFKLSNLESEKSMNFKFEKYLIYKISNFKLNYKKADKSVLSEVNYEKQLF